MDSESKIQAAIEALQSGAFPSVRQAAYAFNIPKSTLHARIHGRLPHKVAHEAQQRFSNAEEASIAKAVYQMDSWGWPMTIFALDNFANDLLRAKGDPNPVGANWHTHFLTRHQDLKIQRSRTLDQARRDGTSFPVLQQWFQLFQTARIQYGVPDDDIYNMDEKGCMKGIGERAKVILPKSEAQAYSNQPGNRDWVSIIECVNTTGFVLPPFIIFQGKKILQGWAGEVQDKRTCLAVSENGWTDHSLALEWLQHFHTITEPRRVSKYRLLLMDGHSSHVTLEFVEFCQDHDIIPLCLPPHSTHILQPLDVGIFGPLATAYRTAIQKQSVFGATRVDNLGFLRLYQQARLGMAKNVPSAWRGAGLVPFDPDKVLVHYRPKTPPFASLTDENGTRADIQVDNNIPKQVDDLVAQLLQACPTPLRPGLGFIKDTALTALADRQALLADKQALQALNQGLVDKQQRHRQTVARKYHGEARILRVDEMEARAEEQMAREKEEEAIKARKAALRGKVGFAKLVWKEMPVSYDIFD
jgi:hypothetical protein